MAESRQLRVGLIGFGHWGPHYARTPPGPMGSARLAARGEPAAARLAAFERQYPAARAYADYTRLLRDGDVDAVIVATPTSTHREVVERCLKAGVHVLVEKPLASTVADAEALAALEKDSGRVLMVGHTFLFTSAVRDGDIVIPRLDQREPLREQLEHFVDCIVTGRRPIASADDGVAIVKVLERAQHELRAGSSTRLGMA